MNAALSVVWLALATTVASGDHFVSRKERPVAKVVRLLEDMKAELEKEKADDDAVFKELDCWCKQNRKEKTKAIELGEAKIEDLKSSMGEFAGKIEELRQGLASTRDTLRQDQQALDSATAIRVQAASSFHNEEKEMLDTIQACKQAIVVLSKHHPSLGQLRSVAKTIEALKATQFAKGSLGRDRVAVLRAFLQQREEASREGAAGSLRIPGYQSYAPQSGQIFGILQQMQEEFESDLSAAQKEEAKAVEEYQALKAAKQAELAAGEQQLAQLKQDDAEFREKNEQAYEEFLDTQEQLKTDKTFLANLERRCAETEEEYQARTKGRLEELAAVQDAIAYLSSDDAFEVFDRTVNTALLQTGAIVQHKGATAVRGDAVAAAKQVLRKSGSAQLALLAEGMSLDAFTEVKAAIDKMVAELKKQQAEEVQHRDWCLEELQGNKRSVAEKTDKQQDLETQIADTKKAVATLSKEIKASKDAIAAMQAEMKEASEIREGEHADFEATVTDQRITQVILQKAIDRLKEVYAYALVQRHREQEEPEQPGAPHIQLSGTATDPSNGPARFTKYERNASGNKVVVMLETVLADSKKLENEALAGEQDAQAAYEGFMKDSNDSIAKHQRAIVNMSEDRAKAEESLSMAESDLEGTMKELGNLHGVLLGLHDSCDFVLDHFETRQEARATEMEALQEAKAILSGMK